MATIIHYLWESLTMATGPTTAEKDALSILRIACDTAPFSFRALLSLHSPPGYRFFYSPSTLLTLDSHQIDLRWGKMAQPRKASIPMRIPCFVFQVSMEPQKLILVSHHPGPSRPLSADRGILLKDA